MLRLFSPARLAVAGLLVAAVAVAVWVFPTDSYIFLPNRAHPVAPLVKVEGGNDPQDGGGIFFVDVLVRKATLLERLFPGFRRGRDGRSGRRRSSPTGRQREPAAARGARRRWTMSQQVAAAVALRELGYKVIAKPIGARIEFVDPEAPAAGKLLPGDMVTSADGKRVNGPAGLRRAIAASRDRTSRGADRSSAATSRRDQSSVRPSRGRRAGR